VEGGICQLPIGDRRLPIAGLAIDDLRLSGSSPPIDNPSIDNPSIDDPQSTIRN